MLKQLCYLFAFVAAFCASGGVRAQAGSTGNRDFDQQVASIRSRLVVDPPAGLAEASALRTSASFLDPSIRPIAEASADWLRAEGFLRTNRAQDALETATAGLRLITNGNPRAKLYGDLLIARGGAAAQLGNIQGALEDYQNAFRIFGTRDSRGQAIALINIAAIYWDAGDFENALRYDGQAIDAYGKEPSLLMTAYNNRGNALIELKRSRQAEVEYRRALTAARQLGSDLLIVRVLQNIARSQSDSGENGAAETTLSKAFLLAAAGPAASWRPALYNVAAMVALREKKLERAESLIDRAFAGVVDVKATMPMKDFHKTAYEIFKARGRSALALFHLEQFNRLDDEARALTASTNAALMRARFDFANQDLKITRLQIAQANASVAAERTRVRFHTTIILGLLAAAAVISTLLGIGFFSIRRSRNQVRAANATLQTTNTELAKALAAKSEFLATTSHEIRTPLNGILGMTQVMLTDRGLAAPLRSRIELVHGAGETMRALVDDILDVAKMETGELRIHPAEMNLRRLLEDAVTVWSGQAETKGIGVELVADDSPTGIVADEVRLRQIVFNLMSNAIKFTDAGSVRLVATVASAPAPAAGAGGADERLRIRIEDSGIGIPPDRLDDIFESFRQVDGGTTRRHGGTGLGLAICRNLARAMGGDVRVESVLGQGSAFTVDLPLERVELAVAATAPGGAGPTRLAEAAVLLVEANPLSQGILRAVLTPHVGSLAVAGDAAQAQAAIAQGGVDHALLDGATLGLDPAAAAPLAQAMRAAGRKVTALWPAPPAETLTALATAGVEQVLAKPIAAPDLIRELQAGYDTAADRDIAA